MKRLGLTAICAALLASASGAQEPAAPEKPIFEIIEPMVYFEPGSVETKPGNEANWRSIGRFTAANPPGWMVVSTHADSSRTDEESLALSVRRGEAVAARLVRMGVDPTIISIVACGEFKLAVGTGDGVEEPLNNFAWVQWGDGPKLKEIPDSEPPCKTWALVPGKGASAAP